MFGNSLAVQWLGLCTFTAEVPGSTPGWGTNIPQAVQRGKKKKKKDNSMCFSLSGKQTGLFLFGGHVNIRLYAEIESFMNTGVG